jgi:hypothetical protein
MPGGPWTLHQLRQGADPRRRGRRADQRPAGLQRPHLGPLPGRVRTSLRRGAECSARTARPGPLAPNPGSSRATRTRCAGPTCASTLATQTVTVADRAPGPSQPAPGTGSGSSGAPDRPPGCGRMDQPLIAATFGTVTAAIWPRERAAGLAAACRDGHAGDPHPAAEPQLPTRPRSTLCGSPPKGCAPTTRTWPPDSWSSRPGRGLM